MIEVEIANEQQAVAVDAPRLCQAAQAVLQGEGIGRASLSIAVVDGPTIHQLNQKYLGHDYETDVLSFLLEHQEDWLAGEVVVCASQAVRAADRYGWAASDELMLYVIHGTLHLVGYEDDTPQARRRMRRRERRYLSQFQLQPRYRARARG